MQSRGINRRDHLLMFIFDYRQANGYSPSVSEMAQELGTVRSNVHYHLRELQEAGLIEYTRGVARSWRPLWAPPTS